MDADLLPKKITYAQVVRTAKQYDECVPAGLNDLDELRYRKIPESIQARRKGEGDRAWLEKSELESLVTWKLKHGTFRPKLAQLVASNATDTVKDVTADALGMYQVASTNLSKSLKTLTALKGIGPATASLILSCFDPENVPFFSDEAFKYLHWEEGNGKGWDRKIGYTAKEYDSFCEKVRELRERLRKDQGETVTAAEIEKMVYVLGTETGKSKKRGAHGDTSEKPQEAVGRKRPKEEEQERGVPKATPAAGRKRRKEEEEGREVSKTNPAKSLLTRSLRPRRPAQEH